MADRALAPATRQCWQISMCNQAFCSEVPPHSLLAALFYGFAVALFITTAGQVKCILSADRLLLPLQNTKTNHTCNNNS